MDPVLTCDGNVSPSLVRVIEQLIDDGTVRSAVYKRTTRSTNSDAIADLQSTAIDDAQLPRLYLADQQTAGRGRHGNTWVSQDDSLTFSMMVDIDPFHRSAPLFSPAVGVAVARAIEFSCAPCRVALKWPNDICTLVGDSARQAAGLRKLGGILIEAVSSVQGRSVIGIGLNLGGKPQLPEPAAVQPTSLLELCSRSISRHDLLAAIAESLSDVFTELASDSHDIVNQYRARCALSGSELSLKQGNQAITGRCDGIDDQGSLTLIVNGQRHSYRSGEVTRIRYRRSP